MAGVEYQRYVVNKLSRSFRESASLIACTTQEPSEGKLLIKNKYLGINASDVLVCSGLLPGGVLGKTGVGWEGVGKVIAVGPGCDGFAIGDIVGYASIDQCAFGEFATVPAAHTFRVPSEDAQFVGLLCCGMTCKVCFDEIGLLKPGEKMIISAAAGGTGQFAVQLAKLAGCHVIGLCSSDEKVQFLKSIGCDVAFDYKKQDLMSFLKVEYPNGVEVAFETVGGKVLETIACNMAHGGRILFLGSIVDYQTSSDPFSMQTAATKKAITEKSLGFEWFGLLDHTSRFRDAFNGLLHLYTEGKLNVRLDNGSATTGGKFIGLESIPRALDHLYGRQSIGKVVVELQ